LNCELTEDVTDAAFVADCGECGILMRNGSEKLREKVFGSDKRRRSSPRTFSATRREFTYTGQLSSDAIKNDGVSYSRRPSKKKSATQVKELGRAKY
jgi:hypothetical protein